MFTQGQKDGSQGVAAETFIGPSVRLEGNFSSEGDVVIEGVLVGSLATKGDIRVGANATIEAIVTAKNAMIAGKIKGNLTITQTLKLAATAQISGDIKTGGLAVDQGAIINGKLAMGREKPIRETTRSQETAPEARLAAEKL